MWKEVLKMIIEPSSIAQVSPVDLISKLHYGSLYVLYMSVQWYAVVHFTYNLMKVWIQILRSLLKRSETSSAEIIH